jgi:hypothetical protein
MSEKTITLENGKSLVVCAVCERPRGDRRGPAAHFAFCAEARKFSRRDVALLMLQLERRAGRCDRLAAECSGLPEADGVIAGMKLRQSARLLRFEWWRWAAVLLGLENTIEVGAAEIRRVTVALEADRREASA